MTLANPKKTAFSPTALVRTMLFGITLLLFFMLAACASNKNEIAAGLPDPDTAFLTGAAAGYNVFIWECNQGES